MTKKSKKENRDLLPIGLSIFGVGLGMWFFSDREKKKITFA